MFEKDTNTKLGKLNNQEIEEYLNELDSFYIEYQDLLDISKSNTFGIEIEYHEIYKYILDKYIIKYLNTWESKFEGNIKVGGEVVSPILTNTKRTWSNLKKICEFLRQTKAIMDVGGHIHIGTPSLGNNLYYWKNFLYLYMVYEDVIYRFSNGEMVTDRPSMIKCAHPFSIELSNDYFDIKYSDFEDLSSILKKYDRFNGVNFNNVKWPRLDKLEYKNTIEFRMPSSSNKEEIWQNNIYFFLKLLEACREDLDYEYLKEEIINKAHMYNYTDYYKMNIKKALELSDIVYDNDYDKARFIKQYYKDGREINSKKLTYSNKSLTKKVM